jgi:hypothetical protein
VFEAVISWGKTNKGAGSVQDAIADFLPHLRFAEMGRSFIQKRVSSSGMVTESTLLDPLLETVDDSFPLIKKQRTNDVECTTEAARPAIKCRRRG